MATELIGYSDKFSVAPGEKLAFKVSTDLVQYEAAIVRLIHGDENPAGPGFKEELVPTPVDGPYPGRRQEIHCGSWLTVPDRPALRGMNSLTLQAWIFPTGTGRGERQGLISKRWSTKPAGYGLALGPGGDLELRVGRRDGDIWSLSTDRALRGHHWYFVAATIDLSARQVRLCQQECFGPGPDTTSCSISGALPPQAALDSDAPLLMAAGCAQRLDGRVLGKELYDGKLDRPSLFRRALANEELEQLRQGASPLKVGPAGPGRRLGLFEGDAHLPGQGPGSQPTARHRRQPAGPGRHRIQLERPGDGLQAVSRRNTAPSISTATIWRMRPGGPTSPWRFPPISGAAFMRPGSEAPIGKTISLSSSSPGREPSELRRPCWSPP